jgi:hypothetical protein
MKITYAERRVEEECKVQIFLDTWHAMTIYHKPGTISIEAYPTEPDGIFNMLKEGQGEDNRVYAVAGGRILRDESGPIFLLVCSNEGSHTCWVPEEDISILNPTRILSWDLKRFREYADDMGY